MAKPNAIDEKFDGVGDFSKQMGCSTRTTLRYIASGELEAHYVAGKYLISRAAKAKFLRGRLGSRPSVASGSAANPTKRNAA